MSQPPPPPPSQPPSGEPSDPKGSGGGYGYPQSPPPPGPPPVQPPAGGFGAPPQPPAGGYGYPQQAPPPPGGAPGFPPQPPPGAGFAPYGQNPQAPGMYQTVPGGPGVPGGGGNGKAIAIVAAAVVAVLAVVTVGFFMITGGEEGGTGGTGGSGGTEGKPSSTEAKELFKIASPRPSEDTLAVPGAWATDDGFAKTTANGVVGMDAASGKQAWKVGFDGPVCAASKHATEDGRTALITAETDSSRAKCTRMVVIDLNEGKKLWQETMPNTDNATSLGMDLTIGDETVAAKWIGGSVAYKITGGSPLWKSDGGFDAKCKDEGYGGGEELVAIVQCGSYAKPKLIVQKVNTKTGKPTWQFTLPDGVQSARIISSDPMVIAAGAGESTVTDVMTIGDDEKLKARISLGDRQYDPRCSTGTESCAAAVVDDEYVYMPSKQHQGDVSSTNEIVAFDIDTGNPKWKSDAGERRTITPVTMDDGKLIAYKPPTYDSGGQVVAVDPGAQGKQELYMRNPDDSADEEGDIAGISMREPPLYSDGRLFIHHTLISQRSVSTYGKNLGLAFGPE